MVNAEYKTQPIEEYFNNPLIEALPLFNKTKEERCEIFISRNYIPDSVRDLPPEVRLGKLSNLSKIFIPTNWGLSLSTNIDLLIREGYRRRNPLENAQQRTAYKIITEGFNNIPDLKDPIGSTFLVGCSGMGKTTTIMKYLKSYPQVIKHENYCGIPLNIFQIVYLHINVPNDGSIKAFCLEVLNAIDEAAGSNYAENNRRLSTASLSTLIAKLCSMYSVGLLILDESQNLLNGNYGKNRLTEFLNNLSNKIGCPFVIIGTPKSLELLKGTFHLCRRFERRGSKILSTYNKNSRDWKNLIKILWEDGLYLKEKNELTPEIFEALHYYSNGVPAILKDLFYEVQYILLDDLKKEVITPELIKEVALQHFPNIQKNIKDINNNNLSRMMKMEDWILTPSYSVKESNTKIRHHNKHYELEDTIYYLLEDIGYLETFSKTELKKQARLISSQIEPGTPKIEYLPKIYELIKQLLKEKKNNQEEKIDQVDLTQNIAYVDELF